MNGPLLLLKTGDAVAPVQRARGDFDVLFREGLGVDLKVVEVHKGDPLPLARGLAGVVVTGSSASVYDPDDWIAEAAGFVLGASSLGVPILGVCFGHQLVADALGGQVVRSPQGREMGTVTVALTAEGRADPLFEGLPDLLQVQESHQDVVVRLPPGAVRLAGNPHTSVQAFAVGAHVRAVQFHPEFDAAVSLRLPRGPGRPGGRRGRGPGRRPRGGGGGGARVHPRERPRAHPPRQLARRLRALAPW